VNKCFTINVLEIVADVEVLAFDILFDLFTYRCILCYRPPEYDNNAWSYFSSLLSCIDSLCKNCDCNICIFGDFNLPYLCWDTLLVSGPHAKFHQAFLDSTTQLGLVQCVDQPTRCDNILDLVLVNDPLLISSCVVRAPFGNSDHETIEFNLVLPAVKPTSGVSECQSDSKYCFNFKEADYNGLNVFLSGVDWLNVLCTDDVNSCMERFMDIFNEGINQFVPVRQVFDFNNSSKKYIRKYPLFIRQLFRKKIAAWRLYKHNKTEQLKIKYKAAEAKFSSAVDSFNARKENDLINNGNLGAFYSYVNNKLVTKSGVGALKDNDGVLVHNDVGKARVLNECYSNVFVQDNDILPDFPSKVPTDIGLSDIEFNFNNVYKHLRQLKSKTSFGPDGLTSMFLKNLAPSLALPLSILFSSSFDSGNLPDIWKMATVTPVFKKGQTCDPSNYRPISLTCVLCKLMESIINVSVIKYLHDNNLITEQQHGFLAKHSTCSQLLECVNDWTMSLNIRNAVDVVYIDFNKAFDTVVHSKLLHKLKAYGITGNLLLWIENFLSNRYQSVRVGFHTSGSVPVISGVPQGSVLGPLLFLLYINDIVDIFDSSVSVKLFADDVKIYINISDLTNITVLQDSLTAISRWADEWQLKISIKKCTVLHLGRNNLQHVYAIDDATLPSVHEVRDLGVTMDSKLCFSAHYAQIAAKAHQRACLIIRCFKSRDPHLLFRAFKVYVRPLLDYCSPVWAPVYKCDILKLESVQRRFTKRLQNCSGLKYAERLKFLNDETLELRRFKQDLVTMYKIFNGLIDIDVADFFEVKTYITRGHKLKITKPLCYNNARLFSFACRRIDCWNLLSDSIISSSTVNVFKHCINYVNFNKFLYVLDV